METQLTFGEQMRRLRRDKNWNLQRLSVETGLSYTHLSRVENDSTVPKAETVAKLAEALGGDLKVMLELADCLPRQILDRIMDHDEAMGSPTLRRAAGQSGRGSSDGETRTGALEVAREAGLSEEEAQEAAGALTAFLRMHAQHRRAVAALIGQLNSEEDGNEI